MTPSSQPENREQTFESKLGDILRTMSIKLITALMMTGKVPDNLYEIEDEAEQAIKTLVLEDVVGRETATYHHHPFLSDYAIAQIHISVNDMMLYDKSQHFTKETREWFEARINEVISRQLEVKCENTLRSKQRQIINPQKEGE